MSAKFNQLIKESGIKGGGLKFYCKTRWITSSESVNSVLNLKSIIEKMVENHAKYLTNTRIKTIVNGRNFWADLNILAFILNPLHKAILALEAQKATLANCFLNLTLLAAVMKSLPHSFNKNPSTFLRFTIKEKIIFKDCQMATLIGRNLGFDLQEQNALCLQLRLYKECNKEPFNLEFGIGYEEPINWWNLIYTSSDPDSLPHIARYLFSICPNFASCKRRFSTLGWLTNKYRIQIGVEKLEFMSKMITYWKSNTEKEFGFYGKENKDKLKLNATELNKRVLEALAKPEEFEKEIEKVTADLTDSITQISITETKRQTTSGELIPDDNVIVLIDNLWIKENVDLSNKLILEDIGEIPEDDLIDNMDNKYVKISLINDESTSGNYIVQKVAQIYTS
ncbi:ribonuclease H-like domain-containing protein [Rhizophagus clarus]|uniref:Ribonuclease H-like domain-containing protein n=1 Tax=Rhizophagus clarus TaxID=94130 RepID=A0A8H3L2C9_9GLOM|nr:ribonuclease H-like domain-containing protein [Rhizophagus clarus]